MTASLKPAPIAVTIATSDSSGGAGIQADLKTFSALGVYGASVLVALTAQNTLGVTGIHEVPPNFVAKQIDAVYEDLDVAATKLGMLATARLIEAVAQGLERQRVRNVVVDPVMVAATGARLLEADAVMSYRRLFPLSTLITPNLPEAAALLGEEVAADETQAEAQGRRILALGAPAVLVKGGHGHGPASVDLLVTAQGTRRFEAPRIETMNTHGTGCTLSSAIAAHLAHGAALEDAVAAAKAYVTAAIAASNRLKVGAGHGPVHHFHALWPQP